MQVGDIVAYRISFCRDGSSSITRRGKITYFHLSQRCPGERAASIDWKDGRNTSIATSFIILASQIHEEVLP